MKEEVGFIVKVGLFYGLFSFFMFHFIDEVVLDNKPMDLMSMKSFVYWILGGLVFGIGVYYFDYRKRKEKELKDYALVKPATRHQIYLGVLKGLGVFLLWYSFDCIQSRSLIEIYPIMKLVGSLVVGLLAQLVFQKIIIKR